MKNFCSVKYPVRKIKRQAMNWENIFVNHISNKGFVYRICQELLRLNCAFIRNYKKKKKILQRGCM